MSGSRSRNKSFWCEKGLFRRNQLEGEWGTAEWLSSASYLHHDGFGETATPPTAFGRAL